MSFARLHKLVAYLISGLGLIALSLGNELGPEVVVLTFVGFIASFFAEGSLLEKPWYGKTWTAAVVLLLLVEIARGVLTEPTLAMAIEFAAFLQISRLANRRTAADYQQIAVLAFLHLIAATVLSTSLSYAVIFVGFVIATPWMLALSQLRREIEGNYPSTGGSQEQHDKAQAAMRRVLASKRVVGASFLVSTALLAVPLFAMTLTIFVIVPRVGQGFLSLRRSEGQRVAGFGNQVELGGFGVIRDDPTVVLRVTPLPRSEVIMPVAALRMRGTSFDHYDGKRWTRTPSLSLPLRMGARNQYPIRRGGDWNHDQMLRIVLDHLDEPVIFLPFGTVAIDVPPRVVQGEPIARDLTYGPGLDLRYADPDELGLVYTAYVSRDAVDSDVPPIGSELPASYLQVPAHHERIAELAKRVTAGAKDPDDAANRLVAYLHSSEFTYSLEMPEVKDDLPLNVFLFKAKRGHCEYFASAMAVMLRTLGIPSRNVTGFVGGRFNPYGGYYALRQGDAHSWVEAFIEKRGWVTYDPTPPARSDIGPRQNLWADVQALIDALRTRWVTSVVGYDLRTQVSIVSKVARFFEKHSLGGATADMPNLRSGARFGLRLLRLGVMFVVGLAVLVALLVWHARRRDAGKGDRKLPPEAVQAVKLYRELDRALAARGYARGSSTTPIEHVKELQAKGFPYASEVQQVTDGYMQARYGGRALEPAQHARMKQAIAKVKTAPPQARNPAPRA
jgi:transglutaminase-like putative cysteine protease